MNAVTLPIIDTFERIEDKFVLPSARREALDALLVSRLPRADFGAHYTIVQSIYLDTSGLDLLRDHVDGRSERVKLRIRRYAPNGSFGQGVSFFESKTKVDGVCKKERYQLDEASLAAVLAGRPVTTSAALIALNTSVKPHKLARRVARMDALRLTRSAMPFVTVEYRRNAFEGDGVRVTIDDHLRFEALQRPSSAACLAVRRAIAQSPDRDYGRKLDAEHALVLEVKHTNGRPAWLDAFAASIGVGETSFSKYCYSMLRIVNERPSLHLVAASEAAQ
jgi:SPX domain protein involved in polyphosphate accumulation